MKERPDLDVAGFLAALRRRAWLAGTITAAAAALAFGLSQLQHVRYVATADLLFLQAPNVNAPERTAATNLALASVDAVVVGARRRLRDPHVSLDELRNRVKLEPQGQADLLQVNASAETAAGAAALANAFADEVVAVRRVAAESAIQRSIDAIDARLARTDASTQLASGLAERRKTLLINRALATGEVEIADRAVPPLDRAAPKPVRNAVVAAALGLVAAVMLIVLLRALDRRLTEHDAVELFGAPVLARVPTDGSAAWRHQLHAEAFQFLRANVRVRMADGDDALQPRTLRPDGAGRVIVVTSPLPANGKTTVVARLSEAFASAGAGVLAIDCDLRKPTLGSALGLSEGYTGMAAALVGDRVPTELIQRTSLPRLSVIPGKVAGDGFAMPIAGPLRLLQVIKMLQFHADILLVDTAPVAIAAETSIVAGAAAGVIVVLDARNLDRDTLVSTHEQLDRAGVRVIGLVLNFAEPADKRALKEAYAGPYGVSLPPSASASPASPSGPVSQNGVQAGSAQATVPSSPDPR